MAAARDDFKFEIINELGVLSETGSGWRLELNRISWNGREPKYDIRTWGPERNKMGKGVTLTEQELYKLKELIDAEITLLEQGN